MQCYVEFNVRYIHLQVLDEPGFDFEPELRLKCLHGRFRAYSSTNTNQLLST